MLDGMDLAITGDDMINSQAVFNKASIPTIRLAKLIIGVEQKSCDCKYNYW